MSSSPTPPRAAPPASAAPHLQDLLKQTAVLKLNGGLGTSMGLEKAKSLLEVKGGKTFLDLIAEQIKYTRQKYGEGGCWEVLRLGSEWSDGGGVHWCVGLVLGGGGGGYYVRMCAQYGLRRAGRIQ